MKTRLPKKYAILLVRYCSLHRLCSSRPKRRTSQEENLRQAAAASVKPGRAAGAAEDTFHACMSRIPKDASIGQRMIAEQGCMRDESDRQPFEPVPGARIARHQSP